MLYQLHHAYSQVSQPVHLWAQAWRKQLTLPWNPLRITWTGRMLTAVAELMERCTDNYEKPEFNLNSTQINSKTVAVYEHIAHGLPFCNLLHFSRAGEYQHPKVLIVAPMSGHYSTLLRGTVEQFLPDHEVYITDWINAREVPLSEGEFSFDDYVSYLIEFLHVLGPDTHVIAVCQPSVPAIVAAAVMAADKDECAPQSLTLMGGPIDTRVNPTEVNDYASGKDYEWFQNNVICSVPKGFPGEGQEVYPGFIQLSGFMSMNMDSHISKHFRFFGDLIKGDGDNAEAHRKFYNEYLAVMDLPAKFYLDTIKKVFLEHQLPRGLITYRDKPVDCSLVKHTALMTIEGEKDDITGMGQTKAAHDVLSGLADEKRLHYVQPEVGHYGIFNGRRFHEEVAPRIKDFIQLHRLRKTESISSSEAEVQLVVTASTADKVIEASVENTVEAVEAVEAAPQPEVNVSAVQASETEKSAETALVATSEPQQPEAVKEKTVSPTVQTVPIPTQPAPAAQTATPANTTPRRKSTRGKTSRRTNTRRTTANKTAPKSADPS